MNKNKIIKTGFWILHLVLIKVVLKPTYMAIPVIIIYFVFAVLLAVVEFEEEQSAKIFIK